MEREIETMIANAVEMIADHKISRDDGIEAVVNGLHQMGITRTASYEMEIVRRLEVHKAALLEKLKKM